MVLGHPQTSLWRDQHTQMQRRRSARRERAASFGSAPMGLPRRVHGRLHGRLYARGLREHYVRLRACSGSFAHSRARTEFDMLGCGFFLRRYRHHPGRISAFWLLRRQWKNKGWRARVLCGHDRRVKGGVGFRLGHQRQPKPCEKCFTWSLPGVWCSVFYALGKFPRRH